MKALRVVLATGVVTAVLGLGPAPAHASLCYDKYTEKTCQDLSDLVCYLFERCF